MPRFKYKSTGFSKLKRLLKALPDEATGELKEAVRDSAETMAQTARELVPVRTGALRDAIQVAIRRDGLSAAIGPGVRSKKLAKTVFYAVMVEFGTKGDPSRNIPPMPAQPFLNPAFEMNRDKAVARTRAAINKAVREARAKAGPVNDN